MLPSGALVLGVLLAQTGTSPGRIGQLYHVELRRAVLLCAEGKGLQAELRRRHREATERVRQLESRAKEARARALDTGEPAALSRYESLAKEADELRQKEESALEAMEQEGIAPILRRMRALMARAESAAPQALRLVAVEDLVLARPRPECDRTAWLVERAEGRGRTALVRDPRCEVERLLLYDLQKVLSGSAAGREAARRLESFRGNRQAELDRSSRSLEARGKRASPTEVIALADRYLAMQKELGEREAAEESALMGRFEKAIERVSRPLSAGLVLAERLEAAVTIGPTCDVTAWLMAAMDGREEGLPADCSG